jgi:hypothetical protein
MRNLIYILILSLCSASLFAKEVSITDAEQYAKDFYQHRYKQAQEQSIQIEFMQAIIVENEQDEKLYYVFNTNKNKGFVIIAAEDNYLPVLGYAFEGFYDVNHSIPALRYWMKKYEQNIAASREQGYQETHVKLEWERFSHNKTEKLLNVSPLLATNWDQDCYYNLYAPSDITGPCSHAYIGCVATSMAMVMKYHNYPATGYGSHSYTHPSYGTLSANFGATSYQWSSMPNQLTSSSPLTHKQAISRLMSDCGISVEMNYSPNGSGSNTAFAANALSEFFRYNYTSSEQLASSYTTMEWNTLLKDQLDNSLPMIYSGVDQSVGYGHAWALDGYQGSSHFHMNWGWSGSNNGYFF